MELFYIRHGDPIYSPDSLTPLGRRQAEAVSNRLVLYGLDEIYTSTSTRAVMTAQPTCEKLRLEHTELDFAHENHTWADFSVETENGYRTWVWNIDRFIELFTGPEIRALGFEWYRHPEFADFNFQKGINRVYDAVDGWLLSLGYEHERYSGRYRVVKDNGKRVALFAHEGFGLAFFSCLLDIPYPYFSTHFGICHSGMSVVHFQRSGEYAVPKVLTHSNDSHLYKDGLPLNYNYFLKF